MSRIEDQIEPELAKLYGALEEKFGLTPRPAQTDLSNWIARAITKPERDGKPSAILVSEAPTGTGKTFAYLLGALVAAKFRNLPVVVATATVTLQEQIEKADLPKLEAIGLLQPGEGLIAKGRGRYFCPQAAEQILTTLTASDAQLDWVEDDKNATKVSATELEALLDRRENEGWNGEVDSLKAKPIFWDKVCAAPETCTHTECPYYKNKTCAYYNARDALSHARVVITNQDLMLQDLKLRAEGSPPLFSLMTDDDFILVVDEAHHLPKKVIRGGRFSVRLENLTEDLDVMDKVVDALFKSHQATEVLQSHSLTGGKLRPTKLQQDLPHLLTVMKAYDRDHYTSDGRSLMSYEHRFATAKDPVFPVGIRDAARPLLNELQLITTNIETAMGFLKKIEHPQPFLIRTLCDMRMTFFKLKAALDTFNKFSMEMLKEEVRWVEVFQDRTGKWIHELNCSPLEGAELLKALIWDRKTIRPILLSATLRDGSSHGACSAATDKDKQGYAYFLRKAGLIWKEGHHEVCNDRVHCHTLPHVLPYHNSVLQIADMQNSPKSDGYLQEAIQLLGEAVDPAQGTLVLFTARTMLVKAASMLRAKYAADPGFVFSQEDCPTSELLARYRARIDSGKGAILLGMQKLSEGLDLPGKYCEHVAIMRLPFQVPSDPVEMTRQERNPDRHFDEHVLPDTVERLVQMCGRLIRRETDVGLITVFDNRLDDTGKRGPKGKPHFSTYLLNALPPFQIKKRVKLTSNARKEL